MGNVSFFRSSWVTIRGNAAMFAGFLLGNLPKDHHGLISKDHVCGGKWICCDSYGQCLLWTEMAGHKGKDWVKLSVSDGNFAQWKMLPSSHIKNDNRARILANLEVSFKLKFQTCQRQLIQENWVKFSHFMPILKFWHLLDYYAMCRFCSHLWPPEELLGNQKPLAPAYLVFWLIG